MSTFPNPVIKSINNFIVTLVGAYNYGYNAEFQLSPTATGIVMLATVDKAKLLVNGDINSVRVGQEAVPIPTQSTISVYKEQFGKIVSASDPTKILYPKIHIESLTKLGEGEIFANPVKIFNRKKLDQSLETGIFAVDLIVPIGKGQRQLIIGDRETGKTSIAISAIIKQKDTNLKVIYTSIGQKKSSINEIYHDLKINNALDNVIFLHANPKNPTEQFLAPYKAMGMAEALAFQGQDVLVILDDLTKHANVYREISLLIGKPVGREAFPGDMFFTHAKILERAGSFNEHYHNGTISCLPIVETVDEDIGNLIPSNIISITDGQIFTSQDAFNQGVRPAINLGLSVSRTGSVVQNAMIKSVGANLNTTYAKFLKYKKLEDMAFEVSPKVQEIIADGRKIDQVMNQPGFIIYDTIFIVMFSKILEWNWSKGLENEEVASFVKYLQHIIENDISLKNLWNEAQKDGIISAKREKLFQILLAPFARNYFTKLDRKFEHIAFVADLKVTAQEFAFYEKGQI